MADAGEVERNPRLPRSGYHLFVTHGSTRFDNRADAGVDEHLQPVREREVRIACSHGARHPLTAAGYREHRGIHSIHLSHSHADRCAAQGYQNRVRLD